MGALRCHGGGLGDFRRVRGAGEFADRSMTDVLQRRRGEIARVSGVNRRPLERLVNNVDARTQLVLVHKRIFKIEAVTEIDRKLLERLPFILQIESIKIAVFAAVIDDAHRDVAGLIAARVRSESQRRGSYRAVLFKKKETAAKRVLIVEFVAGV